MRRLRNHREVFNESEHGADHGKDGGDRDVRLHVELQSTEKLADKAVRPEVPLRVARHALSVDARLTRKDPASEHMIVRRGKGDLRIRLQRVDDLL